MYLLLLTLYTVLTPVQYSAAVKQKHPITRLLTAALVSEYVALLLTSIHYGLFALNGEGILAFNTLGDIMEIFAQVNLLQTVPMSMQSHEIFSFHQFVFYPIIYWYLHILVTFHAATYFTLDGVGCYKAGADLQDCLILTLGFIHNSTLPTLHLEKGILRVEQNL